MSEDQDLPKILYGWDHFPHEADVGIYGFGPGLRWAFEQAGEAMTAAVTDEPILLSDYALISCRAGAPEDLFVGWLNAVIYEMAVRRMIFGRFVVRIEGDSLCCAAYGEPVDPVRHAPACEVKGATYTALHVCREESGLWSAKCVIDV